MINGARLAAAAGLVLAVSATPALATFSPESSSSDPSNDSQAIASLETIEVLPQVTADEHVPHQETNASVQDSDPL